MFGFDLTFLAIDYSEESFHVPVIGSANLRNPGNP